MKKVLLVCIGMIGLLSFNAAAEEAAANAFTLTTTAYLDQMVIPVLYTCQGKDIAPELDWTNIPAKAQSLAIVMTDPDAPGGTFYHWVMFNIPKTLATLPEGISKAPAGAVMGKNSFDKMQYSGPCPPKGKAHTYVITLYALDSKLDLPAGAGGEAVLKAVLKHTVGKATLSGVYTPWPPG